MNHLEKKSVLIIFDIDGTLCNTFTLDANLFVRAVQSVAKVKLENFSWHDFKYSTDSGVLQEIYLQHFNRLPDDQEILMVKNYFFAELTEELSVENHDFAIAGARDAVKKICEDYQWHVAIATGSWRGSALLKLNAAHIPYVEIPLATADDHIERIKIIEKAIRDAKNIYQTHNYQRVIYLGDREWDRVAASQLGLEFIGVGNAFLLDGARELKRIDDYLDPHFKEYLK